MARWRGLATAHQLLVFHRRLRLERKVFAGRAGGARRGGRGGSGGSGGGRINRFGVGAMSDGRWFGGGGGGGGDRGRMPRGERAEVRDLLAHLLAPSWPDEGSALAKGDVGAYIGLAHERGVCGVPREPAV